MNDLFASVIEGVSYSLAGFTVGWFVGRISWAKKVGVPPEQSAIPVVVIGLALATVLQSAYFSYEQRQGTECLTDYNEDFAKVAQQRSDWVEEDRDALLTFFGTWRPDSTDQDRQRAWATLVDTYQRNAQNRSDTPYPDPDHCDRDS